MDWTIAAIWTLQILITGIAALYAKERLVPMVRSVSSPLAVLNPVNWGWYGIIMALIMEGMLIILWAPFPNWVSPPVSFLVKAVIVFGLLIGANKWGPAIPERVWRRGLAVVWLLLYLSLPAWMLLSVHPIYRQEWVQHLVFLVAGNVALALLLAFLCQFVRGLAGEATLFPRRNGQRAHWINLLSFVLGFGLLLAYSFHLNGMAGVHYEDIRAVPFEAGAHVAFTLYAMTPLLFVTWGGMGVTYSPAATPRPA